MARFSFLGKLTMSFDQLPAFNAFFNGSAAVLLLCAYAAIRRRKEKLHRRFILSAVASSILFLIGYLSYHSVHGTTRFTHGGAARVLYFSILISHTILAATVIPLVIVTLRHGLKYHRARHRKWAHVTFPIWLYVSITGVLIYFMLYHWFPPHAV
ncbi:MAG TPA: DUF420 domain-containing protein [Candidatus Krumholzibacteria bacterium]|nr:DUF420 domain-containing protein [Candidatus Krumholzibacteria bacterium]